MAEYVNRLCEKIRRRMVAEINGNPRSREQLQADHGQVWDTTELQQDFRVKGFAAPLVIVERLTDGVVGSLMFQNSPRLYFNWEQHV